MHKDYENEFIGEVIYLDGDETNDEEGNVITEEDFHELVSFEQFAEILNTQDVLFKKINTLEAELALLRGESSAGGVK
jgi:hypothetical protein